MRSGCGPSPRFGNPVVWEAVGGGRSGRVSDLEYVLTTSYQSNITYGCVLQCMCM